MKHFKFTINVMLITLCVLFATNVFAFDNYQEYVYQFHQQCADWKQRLRECEERELYGLNK